MSVLYHLVISNSAMCLHFTFYSRFGGQYMPFTEFSYNQIPLLFLAFKEFCSAAEDFVSEASNVTPLKFFTPFHLKVYST